MNFQMTPQSLGALNQVPIDMTLQALDWQQRAQQADQMTLAEIAAANQRAAQKHVMDQKTSQLNLDTGLAQLPGIRAQSDITARKNKMEEELFPYEIKKKIQQAGIDATEQELKIFDQNMQKLLNAPSGSPERAQGEKLFMASKEMLKAREDNKLKLQIEAAETDRAVKVAEIAAGSREKVANIKNSPENVAAGLVDSINKGKLNYEKGATAFFTLAEMMEDNDPRKAQYLEIAAKLEAAALNKANAGANPQVDLDDLGIKTTTPQATPVLGGAPNPATAGRSARQANSERVVIYKDGKAVGTVPKAQADQAVQEGYTLK